MVAPTSKSLKMLLSKFWLSRLRRQKSKGFTLIELLVAMAVGSLVISGILFLVVDVLKTDSRESAVNETQREMQMAMDYIAGELKEAVYVYDGNYLNNTLINYLPNDFKTATKYTPILAFWKPELVDLDPPPTCPAGDAGQECRDLLVKRRTYTLVVYLQSKETNANWKGKSRILRYALRKYQNNTPFNISVGYVDPFREIEVSPNVFKSTSPQTWPLALEDGTDLQGGNKPTGSPDVLVDFVDDFQTSQTLPSCQPGYDRTPTNPTNSNSFFACVRGGDATTGTAPAGINQDVYLYLRGNANGRKGISNDRYLLPLQTQVLVRGVINKTPIVE